MSVDPAQPQDKPGLSRAAVDEVVYACRQAGDDSTYAVVNQAIARHSRAAAGMDPAEARLLVGRLEGAVAAGLLAQRSDEALRTARVAVMDALVAAPEAPPATLRDEILRIAKVAQSAFLADAKDSRNLIQVVADDLCAILKTWSDAEPVATAQPQAAVSIEQVMAFRVAFQAHARARNCSDYDGSVRAGLAAALAATAVSGETWIVVKEHVWDHGGGRRPTLAYLLPSEFGRVTYGSFDAACRFIREGNWPLGFVAMKLDAAAPQPEAAAETMTLQEVWDAAGGNPGIKPSRADVLFALRTMDQVCDEADSKPQAAAAAPAKGAIGSPEWTREGIADFIADNWPDRKHTLDEIEAGIRAIEINPSRAALATSPADASALSEWRPMDTAPKDGTLLRLLVQFSEHSLDDDDLPQATIGMNNLGNTGEDEWQFAGWCWSHDCFTQGEGTPVGWLPMLAGSSAAQAQAQPASTAPSDKERLDWLEMHDGGYHNMDRVTSIVGKGFAAVYPETWRKTVRDAIDDGMAANAAPPAPKPMTEAPAEGTTYWCVSIDRQDVCRVTWGYSSLDKWRLGDGNVFATQADATAALASKGGAA